MDDLRAIVAKQQVEELLGKIEDEWKAMYHNATIRSWPDFEDDDEAEKFWEYLSDHVSIGLQDLSEYIREDFDLDFKFYTWGRGGATIAPDKFFESYHGQFSFNIDLDLIVDWDEIESCEDEAPEEWIDAYHNAKSHLEAFQFINKEVKAGANSINEWWEEEKQWIAEIAEAA